MLTAISKKSNPILLGVMETPAPLDRLIKLKQAKNISIAIILPALNEDKTIGRILDTWLPLVDLGLIDDIQVIDSGSTDRTKDEVLARKVPCIDAPTELAMRGLGHVGGKGENIWLGQLMTPADILIYADSDMQNPTRENIVNLLSPMIEKDHIMLVKSVFSRDSHVTGPADVAGGRVTRLVVKPILQILFPELNHILQPLNGNIAIKREVIEKLSLGRKYEVDLEILIMTALKYGVKSIAQVHCGSFQQEGQNMDGLEIMAHQNIRLLFDMAHKLGKMDLPQKTPDYFIQHIVTKEELKEIRHVTTYDRLPEASL